MMGGYRSIFWAYLNPVRSRRSHRADLTRRRGKTPALVSACEIEVLEKRALLSAAAVVSNLTAEPTVDVIRTAAAPAGNGAYTPAQLQAAYGFNLVSLGSPNGTGQTIAIVDAYNDPTIQNDLKAFDSAYGLANPPSLTVMSQTGSTTNLPPADPTANKTDDWEVEEALDVEWAHALAPGANIVLVEANSDNFSDLLTAVQTAASLPGVSTVSMSWGGGEFNGETSFNSYFTTPAGHQGVTFVASTGDSGAPGGFPAFSNNVLAVGGTTLNLGSSGNYISESAWSGSGGGLSQYETQPSYQKGIVTQSTTQRAIPDVSFDADPNTGVLVYDSFSFGTSTPWAQLGGTSLSAPSWAAIVSIVDQGRVQHGLGTLDGASQTLPMLYSLDKTDPAAFHDITTGNNGYAAGAGYDLVTGLGSPVVNNLVSALDGASTPTSTSKLVFQSTPSTGTAGVALSPSLSVAIENQNGQIVTSDNSTVTISVGNGPGTFASGATISVKAVNGIATFSGLVLNTAGAYTLSVSDGNDTGATSQIITINAAAAAKVVFQQQPANASVNQALSPVTAVIEDQFGNVVTGNSSAVSIAVASGPAGFTANSTISVHAVNGLATFSNLILATAGTYTLKVTDGTLASATSASFSVSAGLSAPQNFTVVAGSPTTATLSWSSVSGATGYRIFYIHGTQTLVLGTVSASATSVQVGGLTAGSTVSFKVEAYNSTSTADSKIVSVTMPVTQKSSAPVLTDQVLSATNLELSWTAVSGTQGYRIYYMVGSQKYLLATVPASMTSVYISGMSPGTTYQFMVEAYAGSTTQDSNWVTVVAASSRPNVSNAPGSGSSASAAALPAGFAADSRGQLLK